MDNPSVTSEFLLTQSADCTLSKVIKVGGMFSD